MYCLTNICYVCFKKKTNLISSLNSSVSVNEELRRIIGYHAFNLPWLKTKRIILTCEECYSQLRETYHFLKMWHKNTELLQGYIDLLNTTTLPNTGNEAELHVHVNIEQTVIHEVKREVKLEDEQIYTFQWEHIIEQTEDALADFENSLVKEIIYKKEKLNDTKQIREEVKDTEEYPTYNNSTGSIYNESDSEISVNDNSHVTDTESVRPGFARKQMHASYKNYLNIASKNCSKSFITKTELNIPTRIHTDNKSYECAICKKCFTKKVYLVIHMRVHTGEKPYECATCKKCFATRSILVNHTRIHTGEKPYECATCKKCFTQQTALVFHIRIHTGEKPYECVTCKKCFTQQSALVSHIRIHTGEKPFECATCKKCFSNRTYLKSHMLVHSSEKPYTCSKCGKCFRQKSNIKSHMRNKHPVEELH